MFLTPFLLLNSIKWQIKIKPSLELLSGTHIQSMRGVEATTRQLLIAARQVCSTVQGIHLTQKNPHTYFNTHSFSTRIQTTKHMFILPEPGRSNNYRLDKGEMVSTEF